MVSTSIYADSDQHGVTTTIPPLRRSKTIEIITNRRSPIRLQPPRNLSPSPVRRKPGYNIDTKSQLLRLSQLSLESPSESFVFYEDSEESQAKVVEQYLRQSNTTVREPLSNDNDENRNIDTDTNTNTNKTKQHQILTVTQRRSALRDLTSSRSEGKPRHHTNK